jgi:hypothetical protein
VALGSGWPSFILASRRCASLFVALGDDLEEFGTLPAYEELD